MAFLTPLLSATFPSSRPGPHKHIGYTFLSTPAIAPWTSKTPTFKTSGRAILNLSSIGYAIYYPSVPPRQGWFGGGEGFVDWLSDPKEETVRGYERFLGQRAYWSLVKAMKVLVPRMKFRASINAPLEAPPETKYPIVIFSHGLAGTRTTYSQYCSALASEGYVVLSIEHKDGSGPLVRVPSDEGDGEKDGILHYVREKDLAWADGEEATLTHFRTLQLQMRQREVYETYHSFRSVLRGEVQPNSDEDRPEGTSELLATMRDNIDSTQVYLAGHSFGGATVLHTLQNSPPDSAYSSIPVIRAVALDPWLEPLPTPSPSQHADTGLPPLLVLNSPGFTIWTSHFKRLVDLVKCAKGDLITVMNGNHQSFSDFPMLIPLSSSSLRFLSITHELSVDFLQGRLDTCSLLEGLQADGGDVEKDEKGKMVATTAVALHLVGGR